MTLSYFAVMLMFDTFYSFFWCYDKKRNKFLKIDFPVCLSPALECLNGRMDETFAFCCQKEKVILLIMSDVRNCDKQYTSIFL